MGITVEITGLIKSSQKGFRVDVVELASKLDLPVYSVDLPDDESGHICDGDEPYIEVNRNHPVTRQRFTIAHEISHFIKHKKLLDEKGQLDRKAIYDSPEDVEREAEADELAASILMPEDSVRKYFTKHKWTTLTRITAEMIAMIADEFRVSKEMAVTRLRNMGVAIPYLTFA